MILIKNQATTNELEDFDCDTRSRRNCVSPNSSLNLLEDSKPIRTTIAITITGTEFLESIDDIVYSPSPNDVIE